MSRITVGIQPDCYHDFLGFMRGLIPLMEAQRNGPQASLEHHCRWLQDWESRRIDYRHSTSATTQALIEEIKTAPESVRREVFDFLVFLTSRLKAQAEAGQDRLLLADTAWTDDWNTPEEQETWRDL